MKKAVEQLFEGLNTENGAEALTESDVEMLEMPIEFPYQSPPPITRKWQEESNIKRTSRRDLERDLVALRKRAGVNLGGITRCTFSKNE